MNERKPTEPKVLIIFFSYSNQTRKLVYAVAETLEKNGVEVVIERLKPEKRVPFPLNSVSRTFKLMVETLFRMRVPIKPVSDDARHKGYDLVIVAGPTWSYNPSGPVLSFLDCYGESVVWGQRVLPVISCRSYWKTHYRYLRRRLEACGAECLPPWIFNHKAREPWKTLGVFLTVAGKNPKRFPLLRRHYNRYGHTRNQIAEAKRLAQELAHRLREEKAGRKQISSCG